MLRRWNPKDFEENAFLSTDNNTPVTPVRFAGGNS